MNNKVEVGDVRKWKFRGGETFRVKEYRSFFIDEHYYIIEYINDGRVQTVSRKEIICNSTLV